MLNSAVINTDEYEIHIKNKGNHNWRLVIYKIVHGSKQLSETHYLQSYTTAYSYVDERFLKGVVS